MPFLLYKTIVGKIRRVMKWNKHVNERVRIAKEIYIGDMENLARIVTSRVEVDTFSLSFGMTASELLLEKDIGIKTIINNTVLHHKNEMSRGGYCHSL